MRFVNRLAEPEPKILSAAFPSDGLTELDRVKAFMLAPPADKTFEFKRYSEKTVKFALEKLFHGKCAYCESFYAGTQPVDVEHYRPKGEVSGLKGNGYWWLAMDWTNLLPCCIDCNRRREHDTPIQTTSSLLTLTRDSRFSSSRKMLTGKGTLFPISPSSTRATKPSDLLDREEPLLLDPTVHNPLDHIEFNVHDSEMISLVYPKAQVVGPKALPLANPDPQAVANAAYAQGLSVKGAVSIQVYGLNRLGLVQARTKLMLDLKFNILLCKNLERIISIINARNRRRANDLLTLTNPVAINTCQNDLHTDTRIAHSLNELLNINLARVKEMTGPKAPYSELAKAWIKMYLGF